jgi:hypothetical protein
MEYKPKHEVFSTFIEETYRFQPEHFGEFADEEPHIEDVNL